MIEFVNALVYAFDPVRRTYRQAERLVVEGTRIAALDVEPVGLGAQRIDLGGATVVPAFADCHVHLTDTGLLVGERDLGDVRNAHAFADRVANLDAESGYLFAGNYEETGWVDSGEASAAAIDASHPDALAMLTRIDGHSSLVNRRTFAWLALPAQTEGIERDAAGVPTGRLFLAANWQAQTRFLAALPTSLRRKAERRAARLALAQGALHLHVQLIGFGDRAGYAAEIEALTQAGPCKWHPKICERDPTLARDLGLPYVGGDVFLDGSLGSGTAALRAPYCDRPASGHLALDDAAVREYFAQAERLGVSAGVHAIGDRAIEQCLAAWEDVLGAAPSSRNRHFIEHFEIASPDQIERCARLGIFLSMQPQFDALWGGDGGMYERRLGRARSRTMNAFASALRAGATLCGGDDSPVCALAPLAGMAAACAHHVEAERLQPLEALTMYAYDAARLGFAETHTGALLPGRDADFVVLDRDPFADGSFAATRVLQTWADGTCVYDVGEKTA
ncbi:MAG: amidohydrolase family protein [Candidatus Baltobacteraceae bacterium]